MRCLLGIVILAYPIGASAGEIGLQLRGSSFEINGELLNFDGKNYVINSDTLGSVTVSVDKFVCISGDCPTKPTVATPSLDNISLRFAGSSSMGYELMPELIKKYVDSKGMKVDEIGKDTEVKIQLSDAEGNPAGLVELSRQGSNTAFDALLKSKDVIGMSTQPISDAQIGEFAKVGYYGMDKGAREHAIAQDGLVIITSSQNPVASLTIEEISRIFSGEITNWSELGQEDLPIRIYWSQGEKGLISQFNDLVMKPFKRTLAASAYEGDGHEHEHDGHTDDAEHEGLARAVAADPASIGIVHFVEKSTAKPVSIEDSCGIIHRPDSFSLKSGEYPLSRVLYFYTTDIAQPNNADFIGYTISDEGQKAIADSGFVNRRLIKVGFDRFQDRILASMTTPENDTDLTLLRQLLQDLRPGFRLSSTIRFDVSGSEAIDAESSQQISSIVDYITSQDLDRYNIYLAGFSDSTGQFAANVEISRRRAATVRDALVATAGSKFTPQNVEVKGYGKLFPVACNDTKEGRSKNRRVEVWLVPRHAEPNALNRQP